MKTIKHTTRIIGLLVIVFSILLSCKKDETIAPPPGGNGTTPVILGNCSQFTGYFTINIDGEYFELAVDSETHYTNVYNWFGYEESDFVIYGRDQNLNDMHIGMALPGKFMVGSTTYSTDSLDSEFFEISVDTFDLRVSNITFNVVTSNLDQDGIYKPLKASFTGLAHSDSFYNGQIPSDTLNISGTICLHTYIIP